MVELNIKELLENSGNSKYWLAKKLETNYQAINRMLDGKTVALNLNTINKLCELFDCTPNDIFKYTKNEYVLVKKK